VGFLVGFVVIFLFLFLAAKHPTSVITEKSILIDKYLLYALRDLSLQLQSGQTIFGGIVAVSDAKYAEVSAEFYLVAQKVNSGKPLEDVLHDRLQFIRSDYLKKTYWQIINSIRSGSDLRGGLSSIIEQLNNEQKTKIQNYARELNLWSLVYMLFAVAIPTIGSTMLVILSTFASFGVSPQMFILFIVCCFIVQTALIFFVKSRRPVVQF
jgi:flagellar protein FlaJ